MRLEIESQSRDIAEHPELSDLLDSGGTSLCHGSLLALWRGIDQDFDISKTIQACRPSAASVPTFDNSQSAKLTAMMKEAAEAHTADLRKDLADLQSENYQLADQAMATAARHNDSLSKKRLSAITNLRSAKKRVTLSGDRRNRELTALSSRVHCAPMQLPYHGSRWPRLSSFRRLPARGHLHRRYR
jgi:hypothetical protein